MFFFLYSVKIKRKCQAVQMNLIFIQRCDISQSPRVKGDNNGSLSLPSFQILEDILKQGGRALVFF